MLGLVGTNGIGKSTALKVLAGKLKPNLGRFNVSRDAEDQCMDSKMGCYYLFVSSIEDVQAIVALSLLCTSDDFR